MVILGKAAQFAAGTDFFRWACQIAKYEVYNYRRRQQAQRVCFSDALLDQLAARRLEGADALEAELDALRRCVEILPPADRELIRQRYARQITSRALAVELGRPESSVYKAIHRIRPLAARVRRAGRLDGSRPAALADGRKTRPASAPTSAVFASAAEGGIALNLHASTRDELHTLVESLFEEQLDDAGHDRLAELLAGSAEAQWLYLREMNLHAGLAWDAGTFGGEMTSAQG